MRWPKQIWIPVPVAEAQTARHPIARELLAKQVARGIPNELTSEASQPTALRSPMAREVPAMEMGEQEPIPMDMETQEEPTVPSSGATTGEPMIPTDLECQVKTTEEATTQETVTLVTKGKEPMRPPSIETRTVETQKGNYLTIDMRNLEQLGRTKVLVRGLTKPVQVAPPSEPALGPAEVPGMVDLLTEIWSS